MFKALVDISVTACLISGMVRVGWKPPQEWGGDRLPSTLCAVKASVHFRIDTRIMCKQQYQLPMVQVCNDIILCVSERLGS